MATYYWVGGSGTWNNVNAANWSLSSGGAGGAGVPILGDTANFDVNSGTAATITVAATATTGLCTITKSDITISLSGSPTFGDVLTLTAGTISLNGNTWTVRGFQSTNSNPRTLNFGGGKFIVTGVGIVVWDMTIVTNAVFSGTVLADFTDATAGTRYIGHSSGTSPLNANVLAGTGNWSDATTLYGNLNFTGFSGSLVSGIRTIYGSLTLSPTMTVASSTFSTVFAASVGTQTITSNGVLLDVPLAISGTSTVQLADALNIATRTLTVNTGTFTTGGFNVTAGSLSSSGTVARTINLGASTVTLSAAAALTFTIATNLTFNAGTSTIICSATGPTLDGGGKTFYNVAFNSTTAGFTTSISGANTFNDVNVSSVGATGIKVFSLAGNQTINGALTLGAANTAIRRIICVSSPIGTQRTLTVNGSLATLADVDFRDISAAGTVATPWTGTRLGNCKNNTNITFAASKTVYWNLAGVQNWSATGWATTNNGVPAVNNFPLAQDTATFTEVGAAGTVTIDTLWQIGSIQMADGVSNRTTAFTLNSSIGSNIYGNVTLFSNLVMSGTAALSFTGQGVTQTLTSAGVSFTAPITINSATGTVRLSDNLTLGSTLATTLTFGVLDLNGKTLSTGTFSSSNTNVRTLAFGTNGTLTITGSGTAFNAATGTNLTTTGTGIISMTNASAKTFAGGSRSYPTLNQGGAGALTISGSNTFTNITNTTQPVTVTFTSGTTQTFNAFSLSGTAGNLVTLNTTVAGSRATLLSGNAISVSYCSIQDLNATGGSTWSAFTSNGNVDAGNNTGWSFTPSPAPASDQYYIDLRSFTEPKRF